MRREKIETHLIVSFVGFLYLVAWIHPISEVG